MSANAPPMRVMRGPNQYPPMRGLPHLREAVAEHYARLQGVSLDWKTEVTITSGATEALAAALLAVLVARRRSRAVRADV